MLMTYNCWFYKHFNLYIYKVWFLFCQTNDQYLLLILAAIHETVVVVVMGVTLGTPNF